MKKTSGEFQDDFDSIKGEYHDMIDRKWPESDLSEEVRKRKWEHERREEEQAEQKKTEETQAVQEKKWM